MALEMPIPLKTRLTYDGKAWLDAEGVSHETLIAYVCQGVLKFCGCGDPEANLRYIREGLLHLAESHQPRAEWMARGIMHFGSLAAMRFFWYWADAEGLTEHGVGLPGWLTAKGHQLLADITDALAEETTPIRG